MDSRLRGNDGSWAEILILQEVQIATPFSEPFRSLLDALRLRVRLPVTSVMHPCLIAASVPGSRPFVPALHALSVVSLGGQVCPWSSGPGSGGRQLPWLPSLSFPQSGVWGHLHAGRDYAKNIC